MSARSFDITKLNKKQSNIVVVSVDNGFSVRLHGHEVFFKNNGIVILSSCGYRTNTTKTAINRAFDQIGKPQYGVFQRAGQWFLKCGNSGVVLPFVDNMQVHF